MTGDAVRRPLPNVGPGPDTLTLAEFAAPVEPADPTTVGDPVRLSVAASYRGRTITDRPEIDALLTAVDRAT